MKVTQATDAQKWNSFIQQQASSDILQSWQWGEAKRGELWQPLRIHVEESQGQIIGQAQILIRTLPLGFKLYYMPRGPILDYTKPQASEILKVILNWTKEHASRNRGLLLKLGPAITHQQAPQFQQTAQSLKLHPNDKPIQTAHTRIVDLTPSEVDIFKSFDKDTRNLVRRAAKEGVIVDHYDQPDNTKQLRMFHNLYSSTADRASFVARSWKQVVQTWQTLSPAGMAHIYIASADEQPLAASIVLTFGSTAYQIWSGSRRDVSKKFATYALQWTIIQDMKTRGYQQYDMWGTAPTNDPQHPWAGISQFKKGFGGHQVDFIGDYDLALSPLYHPYLWLNKLRYKIFKPR